MLRICNSAPWRFYNVLLGQESLHADGQARYRTQLRVAMLADLTMLHIHVQIFRNTLHCPLNSCVGFGIFLSSRCPLDLHLQGLSADSQCKHQQRANFGLNTTRALQYCG